MSRYHGGVLKDPLLSVVMPVYNEEGAIVAAVDEVKECILSLIPESEFVVVDDGSRDGTGRLLDAAGASDPRIKVIHQPNGGHGAALLTGLKAATGEYIFLIDSDRQIPLDNFKAALAGVTVAEAFLPANTPGTIEHWMGNEYYESDEAFLFAIAEAMREEYKAIVDAGFILQLDCPDLAMSRHNRFVD